LSFAKVEVDVLVEEMRGPPISGVAGHNDLEEDGVF
jgi:hypothetical protein